MGVGLNTMLAAIGAGGVAASKVATSISENAGGQKETLSKEQTPISEANDADKNAMMAAKAKLNAEKLKGIKLQTKQQQLKNRKLRLENRALKGKETGGSK